MQINHTQNIPRNTDCCEIYDILITELTAMTTSTSANTDSIENATQTNPFEEHSSSQDTVETFLPETGIAPQIKEIVQETVKDASPAVLNRIITSIIQIKNKSLGKVSKFAICTEDFVRFVVFFLENLKTGISPVEKFIQVMELEKNRAIAEPFAIKYFKVVWFMQMPGNPNFYEVSTMFNIMKIYFKEHKHARRVMDVIMKEFILSLNRKYVSNIPLHLTSRTLTEFGSMIESVINAFNGTVIELDTEASEISKIIFVMLCFYVHRNISDFLNQFGVKELFYCAVRSVYQGQAFAKKLECLISSKLRWKLKMDDLEYTSDKVYQTLFKYEYAKIVGKVRYRRVVLTQKYGRDASSSSSEEGQKVLITKVLQRTPKLDKSQSKYAFSPLSRRIGESTGNKDNLDSKRKLRFE